MKMLLLTLALSAEPGVEVETKNHFLILDGEENVAAQLVEVPCDAALLNIHLRPPKEPKCRAFEFRTFEQGVMRVLWRREFSWD